MSWSVEVRPDAALTPDERRGWAATVKRSQRARVCGRVVNVDEEWGYRPSDVEAIHVDGCGEWIGPGDAYVRLAPSLWLCARCAVEAYPEVFRLAGVEP